MTEEQAQAWLKQVKGNVYRNSRPYEDDAWVAVVRTPAVSGNVGKIIVAFGESLVSATGAAEEQWQEIWGRISSLH